MLVVNLFGGPGVGKSTLAAGIFCRLKRRGFNVELVTEYAKDLTWEKNHCKLGNQLRVFAEQYHRLQRLNGQVDIAITDAPLLASIAYAGPELPPSFAALVADMHRELGGINILLHRTGPYQAAGRLQAEVEALALDRVIEGVLAQSGCRHEHLQCGEATESQLEALVLGGFMEQVMKKTGG